MVRLYKGLKKRNNRPDKVIRENIRDYKGRNPTPMAQDSGIRPKAMLYKVCNNNLGGRGALRGEEEALYPQGPPGGA